MGTQRTIDEVLAGLPDNTAGEIGADNVRDIVETLRPRHAAIEFDTPAATTIGSIGAFVKAAGTTTPESTPVGFNLDGGDNSLTYDGLDAVIVLSAGVGITCAANNQNVRIGFFKNGVLVGPAVPRRINTGSDVGAVACRVRTTVSNGDEFAIAVANDTSTAAITVEAGTLDAYTIPS